MLLIIPIRTESVIRRTPVVNYALIGINSCLFLLFHRALAAEALLVFKAKYLIFHAGSPSVQEFFTYQFLHADTPHLLGNMLFLWVFGNSVNAKMGNFVYALFYLSGGVFAAWGFALIGTPSSHLVGASGAIAAVTTAYLALFPRSHVTVLIWLFVFIHFIQMPAMILIGLKVIVWDNIIAPRLGGPGSVAHSAHLAGYFFGFVSALGMLLLRALPRDQFDILALWKRWHRRREFAAVMADPEAAARARHGSAARVASADPEERTVEDRRLDEITDLRTQIAERLEQREVSEASALYEKLVDMDPRPWLSEHHQLTVARGYYSGGEPSKSAAAFERFIEGFPNSIEVSSVRLLLGIIYARDLRQFEVADKHLTQSMESLRDQSHRDQCVEWLKHVRQALGRAAPET